MKKIVRLTEKQLEEIVRKVIAEQDAQSGEPQQYTDGEGVTYKLPGITDSEAWGRFVNFANGDYAEAMNILRKLSLNQQSNRQMTPNPMDVNIKWNEIKTLDDKRALNADRLISFFTDGLRAIAQTGFLKDKRYFTTPEFQQALAKAGTKAADVNSLYTNYYDVLQKLGQMQMSKIA